MSFPKSLYFTESNEEKFKRFGYICYFYSIGHDIMSSNVAAILPAVLYRTPLNWREMSNNISSTVLFRILTFILGNVKHVEGSEEKPACGYAYILWLNSRCCLYLNAVTSYNWEYQFRVLFSCFTYIMSVFCLFFYTVMLEAFKFSSAIESVVVRRQ